jgi:hypothetical protein
MKPSDQGQLAFDTQREAARLYAESLRDVLEPLRHLTTRQIARELNDQRFRTVRGGPWSSMTVCRLLWRLNLTPPDFVKKDT